MKISLSYLFFSTILFTSQLVLAEVGGVADKQESPDQSAQSSTGTNPLEMAPEDFFNSDLTVFSPAKKIQKLKNTSSATYVLTSDDIRRSGSVNLVDVLRLLPGIQVARVSAHEWAISARGFNQVYGNKILLLVDGTPVESPLFNGILWENINIPLDIIDRIECVRGPGAAIWGTRAMNGLINVITKSSFTYPHNKVSVGGGNDHLASAYVRTGKVISENAAVQTYAKVDKFDQSRMPGGGGLDDGWEMFTANIRGDLKPTEVDKVRIVAGGSLRQADFQLSTPTLSEPFSVNNSDTRDNNRLTFTSLWDHDLGDDSSFSVEWSNLFEKRKDFLLDFQAYYSDLELRHRFHPVEGHDFSYGVNFRFYNDSTTGSTTLSFDPSNSTLEYYRGFVHDDISVIDDKLTLTIGSRFEQNDQVGFGVLPTVRLLWNVTEKTSVWGSVSRTQGAPSRIYDNIRLNVQSFREPESGLPALAQVTGNKQLGAEKLTAYEIGTWTEPVKSFYVSATAFYFRYNDVVNNTSGEVTPVLDNPETGPYLLIPLPYSNGLSADSAGAELTADYKVTDWFDFAATYGYLSIVASPKDSQDKDFVEDSPRHSATLQSHFNLSTSVELDGILRFVDRLSRSEIPSYLQADLRLAWLVKQDLELELIGRNLLEKSNQEFGPLVLQTPNSEIERSVFLRANFTF